MEVDLRELRHEIHSPLAAIRNALLLAASPLPSRTVQPLPRLRHQVADGVKSR